MVADPKCIGYMDHFHHRIVQRLLHQDLGPPALSPYRRTHLQQSLRYRHLGRIRCHRSLLSYSSFGSLLHLRSSLVLLDGLGLHLEGVMAMLGRPMAQLLHWNLVCDLGYLRHLAASRITGAY